MRAAGAREGRGPRSGRLCIAETSPGSRRPAGPWWLRDACEHSLEVRLGHVCGLGDCLGAHPPAQGGATLAESLFVKWGVKLSSVPGRAVQDLGRKAVVGGSRWWLEDPGSGLRVCSRNPVRVDSENRLLTKGPKTDLSDAAREGGRRGWRVRHQGREDFSL